MKKTIIAAALSAAVAAPAAMADVSIYGLAHLDIEDSVLNDRASRIGFKGSEDLGNGMKVSWLYETQVNFTTGFEAAKNVDNAADTAFTNGRQAHVTVGGDFGNVHAGYMYFPTKGLFGFSKTEINGDGVADNSEFLIAEPKGAGVAYSNSFGGVKVTLGCANGVAGGADMCDTTDMSATGSFGGVNVGIANYSVDGRANGDVLSIAANTKMGDLTLGAIYQDDDANSAYVISAAYQMGANKIAVSHGDDESNAAGSQSGTNIVLSHAMSKATSVYVANDGLNDQTSIGLVTKF
jgi:predicted porin